MDQQSLIRTIWTVYLQAEGVSGVMLILVCGTLYAHRRRTYFLYWTLAWFAFSLWRLFSAVVLGEHWLASPAMPKPVLLPYLAAVCGWWHVSLWLIGLLHLRRLYLDGMLAPLPDAAAGSSAAGPKAIPKRFVLLGLIFTAGLALLVQKLLPAASQGILAVAMAIMYGVSAAWFAASWWRFGQLGALLLPVSLGMCALFRLYSATLTTDASAVLASVSILYSNALIDFLLQTLTVVAMIVVLLGDEHAILRETGQRLAESEDRFRLVFEHGGVGMALLSPHGEFVQVNPALIQMLGYPAAELLGKHITDVLVAEDDSSSFRGKQKPDMPQYEREKRFVHRDGRIVWARIVRVPVRDAQGEIRYHATIFIEVTARKQAEMALREERDFIAQILQTTDAFILVADPRGRILRFNNKCQTVSGLSEESVRGRPFWDCVLPERVIARVRESFHQVLGGAEATPTQVFEFPWRTRTGDERLVAWRLSLVRDVFHQPRHVIGIGLDVTEQRRLEEQLSRTRKMETLGTLVGGIAHDFNNQLTAILGNLDMVRDDLKEFVDRGSCNSPSRSAIPDRRLEMLVPCVLGAEQAAQRCASMTSRLLTFSRGRLGTMQPIALDQLLGDTVRALQHVLTGIRIEMETQPDIWPVAADVTQVQELLLNLATNARDAMPDGGTLTLSLANRTFTVEDCAADLEARPGSFVELGVRDTGRGMTAEVRERLFEPFFTTKKASQGAGMGLSVVFGIVRGHKGWITVKSQPDEGSAFHIYLPVAAALVPMARPVLEPAPTTDGYILVVDDEPIVRDLARTVLERWGFRVLTADGGEEALDIYRRRADRIALILLDYIMPRMNGVQVLKELQQLNPEVGVVFSSGYSTDHDVDQLLAAGARAFVAKPYRPQDLLQAIRQALAQEHVATSRET